MLKANLPENSVEETKSIDVVTSQMIRCIYTRKIR